MFRTEKVKKQLESLIALLSANGEMKAMRARLMLNIPSNEWQYLITCASFCSMIYEDDNGFIGCLKNAAL